MLWRHCANILSQQGLKEETVLALQEVWISKKQCKKSRQLKNDETKVWVELCAQQIWCHQSFMLDMHHYFRTHPINTKVKVSQDAIIKVQTLQHDSDWCLLLSYLIHDWARQQDPRKVKQSHRGYFLGAADFLSRARRKKLLFGIYYNKWLVGYIGCDTCTGTTQRNFDRKSPNEVTTVHLRSQSFAFFEIGFLEIFYPYRSLQIGRYALSQLEALVRKRYQQFSFIQLCPVPSAVRFYKKCGYHIHDFDEMIKRIS